MDDETGQRMVGILTPKDLLNRLVSRGLSADDTPVSAIMTPNPDFVSPELTLLDALKDMHEHKYLHLPVCEMPDEDDDNNNSGKVVGLVDVMELICHTATSGGKGWREFFGEAMNRRGNNNSSSDEM